MLVDNMEDFWKGDVGTYTWRWFKREDEDTLQRALMLKVPDLNSKTKENTYVILYVSRQSDNWAESGEIMAWDGNEEFPTLNSSIQILDIVAGQEVNGWHGYLENGELRNV